MEANGESPWEACRRETHEECGLDILRGQLVCVDFLRPRPNRPGGMRFLFDCGNFTDQQLETITLQEDEVSEHRFEEPKQAVGLSERACWSARERRDWSRGRRLPGGWSACLGDWPSDRGHSAPPV